MNSPELLPLPSTAVGNIITVRLAPQVTAAASAPTPQAANDSVLTDVRVGAMLPPISVPAIPISLHPKAPRPLRVPPAIALAVAFWMLGSAILLTLALAYRFVS
ncbi:MULTISPECIES: hypothetical protein [Achromobacter]|jgi:hypothetical protein|uniref:Uncharacterized protein n=1 Tax=Achromobacter kerstersii TaxID=1353890 RepID=A0A6S7A3P0_9BURK|nr:hypothetical protein [Achromobacter kerstersii]CAB3709814.1 hypothetical protein LMG3441_03053 [Achromobacter kerstersii]CUI93198.1 Uncharacterised protein [Achromobacter kerstersii]